VDDTSVAVVTGAASGLGLGLAYGLAARGMSIVVADINAGELARAETDLRADGAQVLAVPTDVTREGAVAALADRTLDRFGRVDVVCLNAGVSLRGRTWDLSVDDWRWIYDVNVFGVVHGIRSFVPLLLQGGGGHVLVTASNSAVTTLPELAPYVSSKHAVLSLAETLQHDLAAVGSDVLVSVALPSAIRSGMADAVRNRPADYGPAHVPEETLRASRAFLEQYGADPRTMADGVLRQALDDRCFAIFTDPSDVATLTARAEAIRDGRLPDTRSLVLEERP
jgi:NAD(P)-dependent dehydrogenase (short-subunit alcohol dehydrogenase family)